MNGPALAKVRVRSAECGVYNEQHALTKVGVRGGVRHDYQLLFSLYFMVKMIMRLLTINEKELVMMMG